MCSLSHYILRFTIFFLYFSSISPTFRCLVVWSLFLSLVLLAILGASLLCLFSTFPLQGYALLSGFYPPAAFLLDVMGSGFSHRFFLHHRTQGSRNCYLVGYFTTRTKPRHKCTEAHKPKSFFFFLFSAPFSEHPLSKGNEASMKSTQLSASDSVRRFLVPDSLSQYYSNSNAMTNRTPGTSSLPPVSTKSSIRPSSQVPPLERGELNAFLTTARGTSNVLNPNCLNTQSPQSNTPSSKPVTRSLNDVWVTGMFGRAPQVATFEPEKFMEEVDGKVRIVRYLPERFERCRIQRPELIEELVEPATLADDGARLMHPQTRRRIHEMEVNGRQGEAHLRESFRQRTKLYKNCLHNYPHGALGVIESPYGGEHSGAYTNSEDLQRQNQAAMRKTKGGVVPPTVMGDALQHYDCSRQPQQNVLGASRFSQPSDLA